MRLPTASKLGLVEMCAASWVYPRINEQHAAGAEGQRLHEVFRARVSLGPDVTGPEDSAENAQWAAVLMEVVESRIGRFAGLFESADAVDVVSGVARHLGVDLRHRYNQTDTEVAGAADLVFEWRDRVVIADLKTGLADDEPTRKRAQLKMLACARGLITGKPIQTLVIHAPRDGRRPWLDWGPVYGPLECLELLEWLRGIHTRILEAKAAVDAGKVPRLNVGAHCANCPARLSCPAQFGALARLARDPDDVAGDIGRLLADPETRALAYRRLKAAKKALQWAESQLYALVKEQGPIELGNGTVFGERAVERSEVDPELAWRFLSERFGVEVARSAMSLKTSKTAFRKAVETQAPRGQKAALADQAWAELCETPGAVNETTKTVTEEFERDNRALNGAAPISPSVSAGAVLSEGQEATP